MQSFFKYEEHFPYDVSAYIHGSHTFFILLLQSFILAIHVLLTTLINYGQTLYTVRLLICLKNVSIPISSSDIYFFRSETTLMKQLRNESSFCSRTMGNMGKMVPKNMSRLYHRQHLKCLSALFFYDFI
jgi:hypothetical protein